MLAGVRWARRAVVVVVTLVTAGSAAAAYVCHPDPPGARTLVVGGEVSNYAMRGDRVSILFRGSSGCCAVRWSMRRGTASDDVTSHACGDSRRPRTRMRRAGRVVSIEPGAADAPDRLRVRASERVLADWPLPARAWSLDVERGTALVSTRSSR